MCGIVAYFGDAENPLTRILTGMWSIIYRAPDSTGVGAFGDELEPVRTRKALGSVRDLAGLLQKNPLMSRSGADLVSGLLASDGKGEAQFLEGQRKLIEFEKITIRYIEDVRQGKRTYPSWADLTDPKLACCLEPGMPGAPEIGRRFRVRSNDGLRKVIEFLIMENDLPPLVVKSVFVDALTSTLGQMAGEEELPAEPDAILAEFDALFEKLADYEKAPRIQHPENDASPEAPALRRLLWRALQRSRFSVPVDYDKDGVRRLFCCLDALVMSRLGRHAGIDEAVQAAFAQLSRTNSEDNRESLPVHWQTLYRAERALNVYGLAAAAVYSVLQNEQVQHLGLGGDGAPEAPQGRTRPWILAFLSRPVLAHGRWALQSQVTVENTHPFLDRKRIRCACVNGQFSGDVERRVRRFLTRVAGIELRSENSTEYFVQLWGVYADVFSQEKNRYETVREQVRLGLDDLAAGSQAIDHKVFHQLQDATRTDIDEMAFIQAMRVMIRDGGQVAVAGISLNSPHRLYAASHNRPLFVVQRPKTSQMMLVSDINAALGLFPQRQIQASARKLRSGGFENNNNGGRPPGKNGHGAQDPEKEEILSLFEVQVTPLQGEELMVRIENRFEQGTIAPRLMVMDFEKKRKSEIDAFVTRLTPVQIKNSLNRTFYETHLKEIPDCLQDFLNTYLPAGQAPSMERFQVNTRLLYRRFGRRLTSLRRIFLVGMGSSFHVADIAKNMIREIMPELAVVVASPVEIDSVAATLNADRDLVLCLSWSGTTADMVQFARDLQEEHIAAIGITEKPFGDMALVLRKSAGAFSVLSGEEITVSGVKSVLCMLMGVEAFCLALLCELGSREKASFFADAMQVLPQKIREVLDSERLRDWSREQSRTYSRSLCHLVIDARHSAGTGAEIALKLEENSWISMGKTLDFRDVESALCNHWDESNLVLVNATNKARLVEATGTMQALNNAGVAYAVVTVEHEYLEIMRGLSPAGIICLPRVEDVLQPFVDLVFFMQLGLDFGLAHGRLPGEFPRNRAKSVTASRSRNPVALRPARIISALQAKNEKHESLPGFAALSGALKKRSFWEKHWATDREGEIYSEMRRLCRLLRTDDPLSQFMLLPDQDLGQLAGFVMDQLAVDGEILLVPMDAAAEAAARTVAKYWRVLLGCFIRVDSPGARLQTSSGDRLVILLAAKVPGDDILEKFMPEPDSHFLWIGPKIKKRFARVFERGNAYAPLKQKTEECGQDLLYTALSLFFTRLVKERMPARAAVLERHFSMAGLAVSGVLNDTSLHRSINDAIQGDRHYTTALFIGPATGNSMAWVRRFDRHGVQIQQWYAYGFSAHGPLVTVDGRVMKKFISVNSSREDLVSVYGEDRVSGWEKQYFSSMPLDQALARPGRKWDQAPVAPFFAHGQCFLPELRDDYDCGNDNLVFIDASSESAFGQALDELATFGCRFARMTVISQAAFSGRGKPSLSAFNPHPISHLLLLPDLGAPVSDYLLPFVHTLLGTAMAARS